MNKEEYYGLLRYIAEEMAHLKFGEHAVEWNEDNMETYDFTQEAKIFINYEIDNLDMIFEVYNGKPKENIIKRIIKKLCIRK
tara:strand:+ start:2310 stop:2555 length:246 start_codon:yes stop_codon:yes gene_type:complete